MPLFEKKKEKVESSKMLDVVLEMLTINVPEQKIIENLIESGASETEAKEILKVAKAKYDALVESKLREIVDELIEKRRESLEKYVSNLFDDFAKKVDTKLELMKLDAKQYTDKVQEKTRDEFLAVQSEFKDFKLGVEARLKSISSQIEKITISGPLRDLLIISLLLVGGFSILTGVSNLVTYLNSLFKYSINIELIFFLGVLSILFMGFVCIYAALRLLSIRKFTRLGSE
ncbi:MAG: hypothetical protein QW735_01380 [archaeon]